MIKMGSVSFSFWIWWILAITHMLPSMIQIIEARIPESPLQCNQTLCTLYNTYGRWGDRKDCYALNASYPTTEEELRAAVSYAVKHNLKAKVVTRFSHSMPKLACPDQAVQSSFVISTEHYNLQIQIDTSNAVVTVDAGVSLRQLIDAVEVAGFSLVVSPYWEGITIGGLISTGAHGSSWWGKGGSVHDHVVGLSIVVPASKSEGYAKILRLDEQNPLFNAAKVSLGVLGAISKVTLRVEPSFKRSITYNFTSDVGLEDLYVDHAKKYEFADITWYPSQHTAIYRYDSRVPLNTSGNAVFDFIGFQDNPTLIPEAVRASETLLERTRDAHGKCSTAAATLAYRKLTANGLKNDGILFTGYPVIGYQSKMQASGSCLNSQSLHTSCPWDPRIKGLFFFETTPILPASLFRDFVFDVKKLRDLNPQSFCGADNYNGIFLRYIKRSDAYLGQSEDSIVIDFNYYRAKDALTPRLNQEIWEELEQMAFFKYGAKPHWGKNRNIAFLGVDKKFPNYNKFIEAKQQLDPQNVFSSNWSDEILFGKELEKSDGCALEGLCICSEHRHCSPQNNYYCSQGLVYKDAWVCRYSTTVPPS
ncbi:L-gulonolactone oxidase 3-like isoform X2 [Arachis stenosperma]|uniref:L-gulonolactone oxidase 3-like isoform X2 n=1 Tax=Arachis stenosperma TaxID=217475 RepID=UPI0025ACF170|nr:L-gulonolactone oxidase 3-like isoform X2 [Arachis stenosperma]